MKKSLMFFYIVLIILLLSGISLAQIPNNSFENWINGNPESWVTNNITGYLMPVSQSGIAHSGNYSCKLEMMNSILGLLQPVLNAGPVGVGIPVTQRHNTINLYYEYMPSSPTIYLVVTVSMLKGGQFIGVGVGSTKTAAGSFTKLTASISYFNSQVPDAATIYITLIDSLFNPSGVGSYALIDDIYFDQPTDVTPDEINSKEFYLYQNYPNPFNPNTKISWQSPVNGWQTIKLFNVLGKEIATIVDEYRSAGRYEIEFGLSTMPSGIYFYQLKVVDLSAIAEHLFIQTRKMILQK